MNELQLTKYGKCIQTPCKNFPYWATLYNETYTIFPFKIQALPPFTKTGLFIFHNKQIKIATFEFNR